MNRRTLFRKAAGLAVLPLGVVALKAAKPNNVNCAIPSDCPRYVPPPADTRSPEQVMKDQHDEMVRDYVRYGTDDYPGHRRVHYMLRSGDFASVLEAYLNSHVQITELHPGLGWFAGFVTPNGNVFTVI